MRKLLGRVSVDSGQVMVGDPCYLHDWKANRFDVPHGEVTPQPTGEYSYDGACRETLYEDAGGGELGNGLAVAVQSGYGDGTYPVYAEYYGDGRVKRITVEFMEDEDDA